MNTCKKIVLSLALVSAICPVANASVPCGTSSAGVLNVGILPGNLPYSDIVGGQAVGFDPLLVVQVAKLLGYNTVNFIGFPNTGAALAALAAGTIDIYANSSIFLTTPPTNFIGIVTDISELYAADEVNGWLVNPSCCALAALIEVALNQVIENGQYAQILQQIRLTGFTGPLGQPYTGNNPVPILFQPFPFASSEVGTIPALCASGDPVVLPQTNCLAAYLQANCTPTATFTGATGQTPPSN